MSAGQRDVAKTAFVAKRLAEKAEAAGRSETHPRTPQHHSTHARAQPESEG